MNSLNFQLTPKVFISYSHEDKDFVEVFVHNLATHQIPVWWDKWEIKIGDSLISKVEQGILNSSYLAVVLSPNSVNSNWVQEELKAALTLMMEKKVIVLPILLKDCDIPLFLKDRRYADFRGDYDDAFNNLIAAIKTPDIGNQDSEETYEYHNDYVIEWLTNGEIYGLHMVINSHSKKYPCSVNCNITAFANDILSNRLQTYKDSGFEWAIPCMLYTQILDAIKASQPRIIIDDEKIVEDKKTIFDPNHGTEVEVYIEARRLGPQISDPLLYEWGSTFLYAYDQYIRKLHDAIPPDQIQAWKKWLKVNPIMPI